MNFKNKKVYRYLFVYIIVFVVMIVSDYIFKGDINLLKAFLVSFLILALTIGLNKKEKSVNEE